MKINKCLSALLYIAMLHPSLAHADRRAVAKKADYGIYNLSIPADASPGPAWGEDGKRLDACPGDRIAEVRKLFLTMHVDYAKKATVNNDEWSIKGSKTIALLQPIKVIDDGLRIDLFIWNNGKNAAGTLQISAISSSGKETCGSTFIADGEFNKW